jgi:hypothetical protein
MICGIRTTMGFLSTRTFESHMLEGAGRELLVSTLRIRIDEAYPEEFLQSFAQVCDRLRIRSSC